MPRLEYFVISESVSVDQQTNTTSIFHILEELRFPRFPTGLQQCVATSLWLPQPGDENQDFQAIIRIRLPTGDHHDFPSNFRLGRTRHRLVVMIRGIPIPGAGDLTFELLLNGQHQAQHVVTVLQSDPADSTVH